MTQENKNVFTALVLDFETGGLKCKTDAIVQIAISAVRMDTFETLELYTAYIKPYFKQDLGGKKKRRTKKLEELEEEDYLTYSEGAEKVHGMSVRELEKVGKDLDEVAAEVLDFIDRNTACGGRKFRPVLCGYNIDFDRGFFQQMMEYTKTTPKFKKLLQGTEDFFGNWIPTVVDVMTLVQFTYAGDETIESFAQSNMVDLYDVELFDAHDAESDINATKDIMCISVQRMRDNMNAEEAKKIRSKIKEKKRKHFKLGITEEEMNK